MPLKHASCSQHSVQQADLPGRVLSLSVWHRESLGRNIFLGEVEVPLDTWNWDSEATWLPLQPRVRAGMCSRISLLYHTGHRSTELAHPHTVTIRQGLLPGHPFWGVLPSSSVEALSPAPFSPKAPYPDSVYPVAPFTTDRPTPGFFRFPSLQTSFPAGDCSPCPSSTSLRARRVSDRLWEVGCLSHEVMV